MTDKTTESAALAALEQAKASLAKLPILGPAMWLYTHDPLKKFMFIGDIDWAVLPPVVLDQCRLYTRNGLPYAFVTWASVSDDIDARLRSSQPKVAPHEWKTGDNLWIIDAIAPFGQLEETLQELRETMFPGKKVCALLPDPMRGGTLTVREWPPSPGATVH